MTASRTRPRELLEAWRAQGRSQVHEGDSKHVLALAGLHVPAAQSAKLHVVKFCCDAAMHKSELGLLELRVPAREVPEAQARMRLRAQAAGLQQGVVLVEEMVEGGLLEWFVGCRIDANFGPVVAIGLGGIYAELFASPVIRLSPLECGEAEAALRRHRAFAVLDGARGQPKGDIAAFAQLVASTSQFHWEHRDLVAEIDLNPVIVTPDSAVIADASIVLTH